MINLKRLITIQKLSLFFLLNLSILSAPLKVGVNSNLNLKLVQTIIDDNILDIKLIRYENSKKLNRDLLDKKIDVNIFQTLDQLNRYNDLNNDSIISIGETYIEPMGLYSKKNNSIKNITNGAIITVPKDPFNQRRSLILLEKIGLIELPDHNENFTLNDITSNPFNIDLVGVEKHMLSRFLEVSDYIILSSDIAYDVGYIPKIDSLFLGNSSDIYVVATRENMIKNKQIINFSKEIKKLNN